MAATSGSPSPTRPALEGDATAPPRSKIEAAAAGEMPGPESSTAISA
jgi:hypothetical protein